MIPLPRLGQRALDEIGIPGTVALALLVASLAFLQWTIKPLERESLRLDAELARMSTRGAPRDSGFVRAASINDKVARFYRFFEHEETTTDWLARLHGIGESVGVRVRSAEYRLLPTRSRIDRYEISLPVSGTYAQVRAFVDNALNEIPVLSVDQVSLQRKRVGDAQIEANVVLTLYLLQP